MASPARTLPQLPATCGAVRAYPPFVPDFSRPIRRTTWTLRSEAQGPMRRVRGSERHFHRYTQLARQSSILRKEYKEVNPRATKISLISSSSLDLVSASIWVFTDGLNSRRKTSAAKTDCCRVSGASPALGCLPGILTERTKLKVI